MEVKSDIRLIKGDIILIKNYKWNTLYSNTEVEKKTGIFDEYFGNMLEDNNDYKLILYSYPSFIRECKEQKKK